MADNEPSNHYLIRLAKSGSNGPWFDTVSFHKYLSEIKSSYRPKKDTPAGDKPEDVPPTLSPFEESFDDFWSGILEFLSGSSFLRFGFHPMMTSMFSYQAESFLEENGTRIGHNRKRFRYYTLSDKKLRPLIAILDERTETIRFSDNLPKMLIPALVAHFDAFILRTINDILRAKPEIANSIEKTVSLKELLSFPTIEIARASIIDKEIDSVMRDSHEKHLQWIAERVGVKFEPEQELRDQFFELCERRNVIIHNAGRVNAQYLRSCERLGIKTAALEDGQPLHVSADYFAKAVSCIVEMALKISQVCWRKLDPQSIKAAERSINSVTYELIYRRKFRLAIRLFDFCRNDIKRWESEEVRLMTVINHANALRLVGDDEKCKEILEKEDWTARSLNFQICALAVQGEFEKCTALFELHKNSIGIDRVEYADWPVFEGLREHEPFRLAFRQAFGEELVDEIISEDSDEDEQLKL